MESKGEKELDTTKVIKGFVQKSRIYASGSMSIFDCLQRNLVKKKEKGMRSKF